MERLLPRLRIAITFSSSANAELSAAPSQRAAS